MASFETQVEIIEKVRAFYRDNYNMPSSSLPCHHCIFEQEPDTECGYVWITCTSDDEYGCNWGNV